MKKILFIVLILVFGGFFASAEHSGGLILETGTLNKVNLSEYFPNIECEQFAKAKEIGFWVRIGKNKGVGEIFEMKGLKNNFEVYYDSKRKCIDVELKINNKTQWKISTPFFSVFPRKKWIYVKIKHNGVQPFLFINGKEAPLLWLEPLDVSRWVDGVVGNSEKVSCNLGHSENFENIFSGAVSIPSIKELSFKEAKKIEMPSIKCGKWGKCINYYKLRKCWIKLDKRVSFVQKQECGLAVVNESDKIANDTFKDKLETNKTKAGGKNESFEKPRLFVNKTQKEGVGKKNRSESKINSTKNGGNESLNFGQNKGFANKSSEKKEGVVKNKSKKTGVVKNKSKAKKEPRLKNKTKKDTKKKVCKKICKKDCHKECSEKCSEKKVCEKVCSEKDEKKSCKKVCKPEKVCKPVCKNVCEKKCEDSCEIPKQLFDITFELEKNKVSKSKDLTAWITLQNFGKESVPARMVFRVYDSNNKLVYRKFEESVVYTDRLFVEGFDDLKLGEGTYAMKFDVEYDGITERFDKKFEVKKGLWQKIKEIIKRVF